MIQKPRRHVDGRRYERIIVTKTFQTDEQAAQKRYLGRPEFTEHTGIHDRAFQFLPASAHWNLAPSIRDHAKALFNPDASNERIQWHRYAGHGCSSQACCVNFLMPLASDAALLSQWVDHVAGTSGAQVVPIETRHGEERLVAFEWVPRIDYLNEAGAAGTLSRGANSTSVDAAIRFRLGDENRLLLIEWKYTESYGDTRSEKERRGDATRDARYANLWKRPHGPLRADVELGLRDLYLNPWYQLLRQQMLAYHVENDPLSDVDHAMIVHLSPTENTALKRVNGAAFQHLAERIGPQATLFDVFSDLLQPEFRDRFVARSIEWAFAPLATTAPAPDWIDWLRDRYANLFSKDFV